MERTNSFVYFPQNEQGPTFLMDNNVTAHKSTVRRPMWGNGTALKVNPHENTIRFQVVVWSIDSPDVARSRVSMKFRATLFWNLQKGIFPRKNSVCGAEPLRTKSNSFHEFKPLQNKKDSFTESAESDETNSIGEASSFSNKSTMGTFEMDGRGRAKHKAMTISNHTQYIDVPPLSIINAESFSVVGAPDVTCLRESDGLMRWTCMYKATLRQNHMMVTDFPHDRHSLCIQLGILKDRHQGATWDRRKWKLGLATFDDSRGSTRVPHGVVVDNVRIPEFTIEDGGASFEFAPVPYGPSTNVGHTTEECLEVKVNVYQESGYYDKNIVPVLIIITVCAMCIVGCQDARQFFERGLLLLNCAFVQVGLRMNIDNRLPRVRYQIKMQWIVNSFFFLVFYLVVESGLNYTFYRFNLYSLEVANLIDYLTLFTSTVFTSYLYHNYYKEIKRRERAILEDRRSPFTSS